MTYSLVEGLAAISAYGILLIANNFWSEYIRKSLKSAIESTKDLTIKGRRAVMIPHIFSTVFNLIPVLSIAYLAGFLGYIATNSEVIIIENYSIFITICLVLTIALPHFRVFRDIILLGRFGYLHHYSDMQSNYITFFVCCYWFGLFANFMLSPNIICANGMLFILLLPVIFAFLGRLFF